MNKFKEAIKANNEKADTNEFVSAIITNKKGEILILTRKDTLKLDPGKYDFCSGHIKSEETPTQAMFREMKEEIGIGMDDILSYENLGTIQTPHRLFTNTKSHIYHIVIDISLDEINTKIKQVSEPEMEFAQFLNSEETRNMLRNTDLFRTEFTDELECKLLEAESMNCNKEILER